MPTFYLHVSDSSGFIEDDEGREFPSLAVARVEALKGLRDILASDLRNGHLNTACFIEIEDEHHHLVGMVSFAEAVRLGEGAVGKSIG